MTHLLHPTLDNDDVSKKCSRMFPIQKKDTIQWLNRSFYTLELYGGAPKGVTSHINVYMYCRKTSSLPCFLRRGAVNVLIVPCDLLPHCITNNTQLPVMVSSACFQVTLGERQFKNRALLLIHYSRVQLITVTTQKFCRIQDGRHCRTFFFHSV